MAPTAFKLEDLLVEVAVDGVDYKDDQLCKAVTITWFDQDLQQQTIRIKREDDEVLVLHETPGEIPECLLSTGIQP